MSFTIKNLIALILLVTFSDVADAQYSGGPIKIGVLNDMSSVYSDVAGMGSVWAAQKAVEDFNAAAKGMKVEIVFGDHQNKPDIGSNTVRKWIDTENVDVIVDVPTSSVALAVNEIVREKNKVFLVSGAATADLTGKACSPNTVHWTYDTWMLANGTGKAIVQTGGDTWFFITADYAFGHALEGDTAAVVEKNGGKVLGRVRHPFPGTDFSSFLLQAQASKAKIIGLANAGGDTINSIKQAAEFGIVDGGQNLAALLFLTDVHALGLQIAQGLVLTGTWYWDMNDTNRAFAKEYTRPSIDIQRIPLREFIPPSHTISRRWKPWEVIENGSGEVAQMKKMPTEDKLYGKGSIRADGRKIHDVYLFQVKKPEN